MNLAHERHHHAALRLAQHGFTVAAGPLQALQRWGTFEVFPTPEACPIGAAGWVDRTRVELYEYESTGSDSDGCATTDTTFVTVIEHPWALGTASLSMDMRAWSSTADAFWTAFDVVSWVPPFILIKAIKLYTEARSPDRTVGHAELDRRYYVRAESDEAAAQAISPALREALVRYAFRGTLALRPGALVYALDDTRFDPEGVDRALAWVRTFVACFPPLAAAPMR